MQASTFSDRLTRWYRSKKRNLPWRSETDPYRIWLSEIILQQTQVAQGLAYYHAFTEKFPAVSDLAVAGEDEVLKTWQGLGYYSRARNLHAAAKTIVNEHDGRFPSRYDDILALKGVGEYTAAAIASFAFGLPYAVVDGNVYRLLARVFGIATPIDSAAGKKEFKALAEKLLNRERPAIHNQAIMEFGSQQCRPKNPACASCPLMDCCAAYGTGSVGELPVKSKKVRVRRRYFNYLVIGDENGRVVVNRRSGRDIWQGLYEFRLIESEKELDAGQLLAEKEVKSLLKGGFGIRHVSQSYKHVLTHQHLHAKFFVIRTRKPVARRGSASLGELRRLAFPRLIDRYLEQHDLRKIL